MHDSSSRYFDGLRYRVRYLALDRLERCVGKPACTVLRGLGGRNPAWLPGSESGVVMHRRASSGNGRLGKWLINMEKK